MRGLVRAPEASASAPFPVDQHRTAEKLSLATIEVTESTPREMAFPASLPGQPAHAEMPSSLNV